MDARQLDPIVAQVHRVAERRLLVQLLVGAAIVLAVVLCTWAALALLEAEFWFEPSVRVALVVSWLVVFAAITWALLVRPLRRYFGMHEGERLLEAGRAIGQAIPDLGDRVVNYLQVSAQSAEQYSLKSADSVQRSSVLSTVPYAYAIPWQRLRAPGLVAMALLFAWLMLSWWPGGALVSSQARLLAPAQRFDPPPPFTVQKVEFTSPLAQGESFRLRLVTLGRAVPDQLQVFFNEASEGFAMTPESDGSFSYVLAAPQADFMVQVGTASYRTPAEQVRVLSRPTLSDFRMRLIYPRHTGLAAEDLPPFIGDATVPAGTRAEWSFAWQGPVAEAQVVFPHRAFKLEVSGGRARFATSFMADGSYRLSVRSPDGLLAADSQLFSVRVLADRAPQVQLLQPEDNTRLSQSGITELQFTATDDYGVARAELIWRAVGGASDSLLGRRPLELALGKQLDLATSVDWIELGMATGAAWEVAIEVTDNNAVTGPSRARSAWHRVLASDRLDILKDLSTQADSVAQSLGSAAEQAEQVRRELDRLKRDALEGKPLDFAQQRRLEELARREAAIQHQLQQTQAELQRLRDQSTRQQAASTPQLDDLKRLQEQLAQQGNQDEIAKFLEQLLKQADKVDNRELFRQLEQLNRTGRYQQNDLSRMKKLFEQWRDRQAREALANQLQELQNRQENLKGQTEERQTPAQAEQLARQQEQLAQRLSEQRKELDRLEDKRENSARDSSGNTQAQQQADNAAKAMQQAREQLQRNSRRKAQEQQQQAAEQLEQLQQELRQGEEGSEMEQATENYENLRQLTENLLKLSFEQEGVRKALNGVRPNDPGLKQRSAAQSVVKDEMQEVADSLEALASRVPQIKQDVLDKTRRVTENIEYALQALDDRNVAQTSIYQQESMTGLNELADMLVESLNQMQMQMRAQQRRQGKPRPGSGSLRDLADQQQRLGEQMGEQPSDQPGEGQRLQEMADRQAEIRKRLSELYQQLQQKGEGGLGNLGKVAEDMQQNEQDLRTQQLTQQTLARQQQILSRMLDFDKAVREREYDEQRASNTGRAAPRRVQGQAPDQAPPGQGKDVLRIPRLSYSPAMQQAIDRYFTPTPPQK